MTPATERAPDPVDRAREEILGRAFAEARAHLDEALSEESRRAEAFNLLGVLDEVRGNASAARTHWRIALLLDPAYAPARENLDRSMLRNGHREAPSLG
jgi:Flp pilus assembly protein TadD